jgi:dTDP-4-amino-4,6-dideoxygalactose transaminase
MTFMATVEAISFAGARPVFVDIDPRTYTMNPAALAAALTPRTKAIIPVHLFGQCADLDPILAFARQHTLAVIEDAAQAPGSYYRGRHAGSLGRVGSFSFYPGKNLGAWGEAGAIVTHDADIRDRVRMLRDHGQTRKYHHDVIGWNGRMDGIQGAVLGVKLKYLDEGNRRRRAAAARYAELLGNTSGVTLPAEADYGRTNHHVYAVRVDNRDAVLARMGEHGVACGIHYPVPIHLQQAYAFLGHRRGDFPVSEAGADTFLSLPMFPELTDAQIETVATALKASVTPSRAAL